jgi:hypothetical protein
MGNFSDRGMAIMLKAIIVADDTSPEKRKWAEALLQEFYDLMEDQEKMMMYMEVIAECEPDQREPLMKERDDLYYQIAFQYYYLLRAVDPANELIYRDEFEWAVKDYDRDYGLKSR